MSLLQRLTVPLCRVPILSRYRTQCSVSNKWRLAVIIDDSGSATMSQVLQSELLDAMKASLRNLENVRIISPDDPSLLQLKNTLRQKINDLESGESATPAISIN